MTWEPCGSCGGSGIGPTGDTVRDCDVCHGRGETPLYGNYPWQQEQTGLKPVPQPEPPRYALVILGGRSAAPFLTQLNGPRDSVWVSSKVLVPVPFPDHATTLTHAEDGVEVRLWAGDPNEQARSRLVGLLGECSIATMIMGQNIYGPVMIYGEDTNGQPIGLTIAELARTACLGLAVYGPTTLEHGIYSASFPDGERPPTPGPYEIR